MTEPLVQFHCRKCDRTFKSQHLQSKIFVCECGHNQVPIPKINGRLLNREMTNKLLIKLTLTNKYKGYKYKRCTISVIADEILFVCEKCNTITSYSEDELKTIKTKCINCGIEFKKHERK